MQPSTHTRNWVLGLTGGIGCGKTAVSNYLATLGVTIVDADIIAREVVAPNSQGLAAIVAHFGDDILTPAHSLNRAKLRALIFADNTQKTWLNNLLHPLIRQSLVAQLNAATTDYVVLVAPLLFENNLHTYCQRTLLIDVPEEVQIQRTSTRDEVTVAQVKQIMAAQMSRDEKQNKADDILNNNREFKHVIADLQQLHTHYLTLAAPTKATR